MIIPNMWENKKCSKPPTSQVILPTTLWEFNTAIEQNMA